MLEIQYVPKQQHDVKTASLTDGQTATVHFKTPALSNHGDGGLCSVSNDLNLSGDAVFSLGADVANMPPGLVAPASMSGSIKFRASPPNPGPAYRTLQSSTDYYIVVTAEGDLPNGVTVTLKGGAEPK